MITDHKEPAPAMPPLEGSDDSQAEINAGNFPDTLKLTSEAVTLLADRLNAVALRVALIGNARSEAATTANIETYLHRLSSLVDSAAAQMRFIQKLLHLLQTNQPAVQSVNGVSSKLK